MGHQGHDVGERGRERQRSRDNETTRSLEGKDWYKQLVATLDSGSYSGQMLTLASSGPPTSTLGTLCPGTQGHDNMLRHPNNQKKVCSLHSSEACVGSTRDKLARSKGAVVFLLACSSRTVAVTTLCSPVGLIKNTATAKQAAPQDRQKVLLRAD